MLVFFDVETTGVEEDDVICSLALLEQSKNHLHVSYDLINQGKKIPPKASSIHNITNEMIQNKPSLKESQTFQKLQLHNTKETTFIAHNIDFDMAMVAKSGFIIEASMVDTLRVTRHLIPDLESYGLNFLRYEMRLYKKEQQLLHSLGLDSFCLCPHNAQSDVIITKLLFDELCELASLKKMQELTTQPVLLQKFEFGKYSGRYIEEIVQIDRAYVEWMLHNIDDLNEDMKYTLEYYL
jgi:DNA polymerase-3 subunit epsilon/exodeoxyribonuclease X